MERGLQAQQQPHRPGATWARIGRPVGGRLLNARAGRATPRGGGGSGRARRQGQPVRSTRLRYHRRTRASGSGQKSEISSITPCPASATPRAMASSSSARRAAMASVAGRRAVVQRPRGREADGPARRASVARARMAAHVVLGRGLQAGGPLAHHVEPQRPVGQLGAQVDVVGPALDTRRGTRRSSPRPSRSPRRAPRRGCPRHPP